MSVTTAVFYLLAAVTVGSACGVAFGTNILYSAFALMGTFLGVAAIFVLLGADFLGVIQLFVYVGGILVLTLFAVMLTHRIDVQVSNRAVGRLPGLVVVGLVATWMIRVARAAHWVQGEPGPPTPTTAGIGDAFLGGRVDHGQRAAVVVLSTVLFSLGLFCVVTRRNAIGILMGIELILNSANINYVAFARYGPGGYDGQLFAIFVIMLAAAEAAIGLAIVLGIYQRFETIDVEATDRLRG